MHVGIDFGTTRTIVASVDRGNYPVVTFEDADGDAHDYIPSLVALENGALVGGFDAVRAESEGCPSLASFKRELASPDVTLQTTVDIGDGTWPLIDVMTVFLIAVRELIVSQSSVSDAIAQSGLEPAVIAVPAHAHGAQRMLTLEAFRRAGFDVAAMINEPSAAGFEYTHAHSRTITSRRTRVLVYDLGGGTFDASLVVADGTDHEVLGSLGVNRLGGDDFDEVLIDLALNGASTTRSALDPLDLLDLRREARSAKERLSPQSRRIVLNVGDSPVVIPVDEYYLAVTPLVERTLDAMSPLIGGLNDEDGLTEVAGISVVGGASSLPIVPRLLRERFGRRIRRSPHPAASTAIGLAIAADPDAGYSLVDRLSRGFGVFREGEAGRSLRFDPILSRDQVLSPDHAETVSRRYRAAHNVGWYRFVEYSTVDALGEPSGDILPFADVLFPFDPELQDGRDLHDTAVRRLDGEGHLIEETFAIDPHGIIAVTISDLDTGYTRTQTLRGADAESRTAPAQA